MRVGLHAAVMCLAMTPIYAEDLTQRKPPSDLDRAVEEFKIQTGNLGLRGDGAKKKARNAGALKDWHGRLYENFRNDFLDAVPHQTRQSGDNKSLLRRNQFGFNLAGPF